MSVLEMNNIRYSYDNKRNVLSGINMKSTLGNS